AFGNSGDILIAISTSGKSKNIRRAIEEASSRKLKTIALLGRGGGSVAGIADVDLIVKSDSTARIQEAHKFILHVICEICEAGLPRKSPRSNRNRFRGRAGAGAFTRSVTPNRKP